MSLRTLIPLLLLALQPLTHPGAVSVYLHKTAHLAAERYTLREVATVSAGATEADEVRELLELPLGRTPRLPTLLPAAAVGEQLARAGHPRVAVVGASVALLPAGAIAGGSEDFYEQLLSFLRLSAGPGSGRLEVELLQPPPPSSASGYRFALLNAALPRPGAGADERAPLAGELRLSCSPADAGAAGAGGAGSTLRLWVHCYLPVAYTAVTVPPRSPLDRGRVVYREEDVSITPGSFVTRADELEGRRSAVGLPAGTRLEPGHLERVPAVRAGEPVQIVFVRPGLRVSVPGRAAGSGGIGDCVEVRLAAGGRRFEGWIAAGGEVHVESF